MNRLASYLWIFVGLSGGVASGARSADGDAAISGQCGGSFILPAANGAAPTKARVSANLKDKGVVWGDSKFRHIKADEITFGSHQEYRTIAYSSTQAPTIKKAKAIALFFHGLNAVASNAGAVLNLVQNYSRPEKFIENGSIWKLAQNQAPLPQGIYSEAIDLPGCGNNRDVHPLDRLESTLKFYKDYVDNVVERSAGQPIVIFARSYSPGYLIQANESLHRHVKGLIALGPIRPDSNGPSFEFALQAEAAQFADQSLIINNEVQRRTNATYANLTWGSTSNPFGSRPALILIGENDRYQNDRSRDYFRGLAQSHPAQIWYQEVKGGRHGVISPPPDDSNGVEALTLINRFMSKVTQ